MHVSITTKDLGLSPGMDYASINQLIDDHFRKIWENNKFVTLILTKDDLTTDPRTARITDIKYSNKLAQLAHRVSIVYPSAVEGEYHQRDLKNALPSFNTHHHKLYAMTAKGLRELRDPDKRDHSSLRWGQSIVNKFMKGIHTELFHANDDKTHEIVEQMIKDYQLDVTSTNSISHHSLG